MCAMKSHILPICARAAARMVQKMKCGFQCNIFIFWRIQSTQKRRRRNRNYGTASDFARNWITYSRIGVNFMVLACVTPWNLIAVRLKDIRIDFFLLKMRIKMIVSPH